MHIGGAENENVRGEKVSFEIRKKGEQQQK
jgi:hypothetical protein